MKLRHRRFASSSILALFIVLVAHPRASAQTASSTLPANVTLDDVLKLLDERSPRTAAERASIPVAAADRITAKTLPNPTFSYGGVRLVSGLSTGAITAQQFIVEQPLLMFHQRRARLDAADSNVKAEEARVAQALADRRSDVRRTFASLLARQEQLRVVQESLTNLEGVTKLVRGRTAAGDRSPYDLLRIETEAASLRVQAMNAATDVDDMSGQLASLLGFSGWSPRAVGTLTPSVVPTDVTTLWQTAEVRRPAIVVLREQQSAARTTLLLATRERLPIPAINGGAQMTNEVNGTSGVFGLSLPLNLFDRNQGAIAKAKAQIDAADLALQANLDGARAEVERAASVLTKRREALQSLESSVMQQIPTLRRMAEDAYREGSADILELLDANRSLRDFQLARVQQLEAVKLAEEDVIAAAGLDAVSAHP